VRLVVHCLGVLCFVIGVGHVPIVILPRLGAIYLGWLGFFATLLGIVGLINAYNFMDGIDGMQAMLAGLT
jgi:UDP-GlcNAc:undecaprenyl-phosphate GlcNAc-1-phosphate transferase